MREQLLPISTKLAAFSLGLAALTGCAVTGNESSIEKPTDSAIANGVIPEGTNIRYSAGDTDDNSDGSTNKCGATDREIKLTNATVFTMSELDSNGTWIGIKNEVLGNVCRKDKDGIVWFSQDATEHDNEKVQLETDLQASGK